MTTAHVCLSFRHLGLVLDLIPVVLVKVMTGVDDTTRRTHAMHCSSYLTAIPSPIQLARMSLDALVSLNTQKARATARNAFLRFLEADGVDEQFVHDCIDGDSTGARLVAVVDRFGFYLAFHERKSGIPLAKSSVMSYYGQVKNWLIDRHNHLRALVEVPLLKKGKTLEQYCMKRETGGYVNKAHACTKSDLSCIMHHEFSTARNATDYQDAALMCLMWHSFCNGVTWL
jgi:hypothetical protein